MAQALHFGDINELAEIKRRRAGDGSPVNLLVRAVSQQDADPE
jgi:hypothetical protein